MQDYWKKCSSCKNPIGLAVGYYVCSVSTCQHIRKGYQFCSVECWDAHLGYANHRESWAVEKTSPSTVSETDTVSSAEKTPERKPQRRMIPDSSTPVSAVVSRADASQIKTDVLVVVSKVKKLVSEQSDFNTSKCCIEALTNKVVEECLKGIENAKAAERRTVMGRDIK